jgi:hypothetical protein
VGNAYRPFIDFAASQYGVNPNVLEAIAQRESGFNPNAKNNWDSNAKAGHPSEGIVQYIPSTFQSHSNAAYKANPKAWQGVNRNFRDPQAQLLSAAWGLSHNQGPAWATFRAALKDAGVSNVRQGRGRGSRTPVPLGGGGGGDDDLAFIFAGSPFEDMASEVQAPLSGGSTSTPTAMPGRRGTPNAGGYKDLQRIAMQRFGLRNDQGTSQTIGGRHTQGSEHYDGRAIDFGTARNSRTQLQAWLRWARANGYDAIDEGDHIHTSLPGSGI